MRREQHGAENARECQGSDARGGPAGFENGSPGFEERHAVHIERKAFRGARGKSRPALWNSVENEKMRIVTSRSTSGAIGSAW
jgi:hypothetical protein